MLARRSWKVGLVGEDDPLRLASDPWRETGLEEEEEEADGASRKVLVAGDTGEVGSVPVGEGTLVWMGGVAAARPWLKEGRGVLSSSSSAGVVGLERLLIVGGSEPEESRGTSRTLHENTE